MNFFVSEIISNRDMQKTAHSKARKDVEKILENQGWKKIEIKIPLKRQKENLIKKLKTHTEIANIWKRNLKFVHKGDRLLIQFPAIGHTIWMWEVFQELRKSGVHIILLLHDLESKRLILQKEQPLSEKIRRILEGTSCINRAEILIVHNEIMKEFLVQKTRIKSELITLKIFDYIIPDFISRKEILYNDFRVFIIAGNLMPEKSGYIYHLPDDIHVNLYGVNYQGKATSTIRYHGSFSPEELPSVMEGGFGLVWDGDSIDTCSGVYGEYLRINNPHKTSLYLAAGIPVIIWRQAALASFIEENNCGIMVNSITEAQEKLNKISFDEYLILKDNAELIGKKLRNGFFFQQAIRKININKLL